MQDLFLSEFRISNLIICRRSDLINTKDSHAIDKPYSWVSLILAGLFKKKDEQNWIAEELSRSVAAWETSQILRTTQYATIFRWNKTRKITPRNGRDIATESHSQ